MCAPNSLLLTVSKKQVVLLVSEMKVSLLHSIMIKTQSLPRSLSRSLLNRSRRSRISSSRTSPMARLSPLTMTPMMRTMQITTTMPTLAMLLEVLGGRLVRKPQLMIIPRRILAGSEAPMPPISLSSRLRSNSFLLLLVSLMDMADCLSGQGSASVFSRTFSCCAVDKNESVG